MRRAQKLDELTKRFETTGMHCPSCSMLIQMDVSDLPGVVAVKAKDVKGGGKIDVTRRIDQIVGHVGAQGLRHTASD